MSGIIKNLTNKANTEIIYPITVAEAVILNESTTLIDALDSKVDKALGKQLSQENYTTLEKSKLYSIQSGAQVNPYTFSTIKVSGSGDVVANQQQGPLTFIAGPNIVLGTSPTTKAVTISATGTSVFKGAMVYKTTNQSIPNNARQILTWQGIEYQYDTFYNSGQPTRLTVPIGVTKVRLSAGVGWANNPTGQRLLRLYKNGSADYRGLGTVTTNVGSEATLNSGLAVYSSAVLQVVAGDYFEIHVMQTSGGTLDVRNELFSGTYFSIEAVE